MAAHPAALQLRLLQTVVEVAAEKNSTLVLPFPVELLRFLERATPPEAAAPPRPARRPRSPRPTSGQRALRSNRRRRSPPGIAPAQPQELVRLGGRAAAAAPATGRGRGCRGTEGTGPAAAPAVDDQPVQRVGHGVERRPDHGQRAEALQPLVVVEGQLQDDAPAGVVPVPVRRPVRDRRLDEDVLVRPAPLRRRDLAVEHLDGQPLGHDVTLGRSAVRRPRSPASPFPRSGDEDGAVNDQQPVQLRVGLAQIDTRVGDLAGNADLVRDVDGEGRRRRRPSRRLPRDDPDRLSGRGPRAAGVLRARQRAGARRPRGRSWPTTASARSPSSSATWRTPRAAGPAPVDHAADRRRPSRRRQPAPRRPAQRRRAAVRRRGRRPLLQAAPAQLRRLRRGPLLRARHRAADRAAARRRRRADRLRGPLGRGRPVRRRRAGRRRPRRAPPTPRRTSGPRTTCGCRWCAAGPRRRRRRSSTATRWAARTSWSSTATRWSSPPTASCWPARPQFVEHLLTVDLDLRPDAGPTGPRAGSAR